MSKKIFQILAILFLLGICCWGVNALVVAFALPHWVAVVFFVFAIIGTVLWIGRQFQLWD